MKRFAVIGLGKFGYYLATSLNRKGHEVIAIEIKQKLVQEIKDEVSLAICADATDIDSLKDIGLTQVDALIICIGSVISESILVTLNAKDLGVKTIITKAISEPHRRILEKIGATEVIFPERDLAISVAERLHNPSIVDYLPNMHGYALVQLPVPERLVGLTLRECNLINQFGVQVIAIKQGMNATMNFIPTANYVLNRGDVLVILGPNKGLDDISKR